jgi:hypothetical protein
MHQHRRHPAPAHRRTGHRQVAPETLAHLVEIDVEHHHHEQEQHHHRADIDQHQGDGQELGLSSIQMAGRGAEGQHQEQGGVHRIARGDHAQPRISTVMAANT